MGSTTLGGGTRWLGIGIGCGGGAVLALLAGWPWGLLGVLVAGVAIGAGLTTATADDQGSATGEGLPVHRAVPDGGAADIELVVAIIRPGKLNDVKQALVGAGAPSLTVTNVSGRGTQPTETGKWRGEEYIVDLHQKVKVECAVADVSSDIVVNAIQGAAHTGEPGDGKIFVLPVMDACRVSTDERGVEAV